MADLSKLVLLSSVGSFKAGNNIITGSVNVTGTATDGINTREWTVPIGVAADYYEVQFNGRTSDDTVFDPQLDDIRPSGSWFRSGGSVTVPANVPGLSSSYPLTWIVFARLSGNNLIIRAEYTQQFVATSTISSSPISYRIIPYSSTV